MFAPDDAKLSLATERHVPLIPRRRGRIECNRLVPEDAQHLDVLARSPIRLPLRCRRVS
jgi:hypothetical protein